MSTIYLLYAIPGFLLLIGIEAFIGWLKKQKYYRFNDTITNLNIGIGSRATNVFLQVILLGFYTLAYDHFAFFQQPANWWSFILCLFVYDFLFYWAHRWGHEINFFWGAHVVHHQSEEYNLSVALRQSWIHNALAFVIFLPMPLLGFDPVIFAGAAIADTLYQFWIHTKAIGKLPKWIEFFWNTPSHHRVHHGVNPKYIDKNYAGVFIIWDKMFGTFQPEEEEVIYGISKPLNSWNPVWANLHYYVEMVEKMLKMNHWRDKLKMIFARPGWLPQYMGGFNGVKEVSPDYKKYDANTSVPMNIYILLNFALIILGIVAYMDRFSEISTFYQFVFFIAIILSTMICGAIFESKKWVIGAEYARLVLLLAGLNTFYYFWHVDWFRVMFAVSSVTFIIFVLWFTASLIMRGDIEKLVSNFRSSNG